MPTAADDKYSRGVLGIRTGSAEYPGAAVLGVEAAWRTGIGMVRYVGTAREAVLQRRPETVARDGRVQAWLIGSGTDAASRAGDETHALRGILAGDLPVVVDAGALDLVPGAAAPMVVTPHDREHTRLREALGLSAAPGPDADADARAEAAAETAEALGASVLVKGSTTVVASPAGSLRFIRAGTPWLATAGTGDVLGGVIGALVAAAACGRDARCRDPRRPGGIGSVAARAGGRPRCGEAGCGRRPHHRSRCRRGPPVRRGGGPRARLRRGARVLAGNPMGAARHPLPRMSGRPERGSASA